LSLLITYGDASWQTGCRQWGEFVVSEWTKLVVFATSEFALRQSDWIPL